MKKRLLAFALASTMLFTSFNVAYAEDAAVAEDDTVIAEEVAADDSVESDAAVEEPSVEDSEEAISGGGGGAVATEKVEEDIPELMEDASEPETSLVGDGTSVKLMYPHTAVGDWKAAVSGNIGNWTTMGDQVDAQGNVTKSMEMGKGPDGTNVPFYDIKGTEESVYMRAGTGTDAQDDFKGKLAGSEEGYAYYYQQLDKDQDFRLTATANVKYINGDQNQAGFGLVVRDNIYPNVDYKNAKPTAFPMEDSIGVGRVKNKASDAQGGKMAFAWARVTHEGSHPLILSSGESNGYEGFGSKKTTIMTAGSSIDLTLIKSGSVYTLKAGDESVKINADDFKCKLSGSVADAPIDLKAVDPDHIYAGLMVARAAEVEWTDVKLEKIGKCERIEVTPPEKTLYNVGEAFDTTGMSIKAYYEGASEPIDIDMADKDSYSIMGFDDETAQTFSSIGEKTLTVSVGAATATINVTVQSLKIEKIAITDVPAKAEYYADSYFNPLGIAATGYVNDGSTVDFNKVSSGADTYSNYRFIMDGKQIDQNTKFTAADAGVKTIQVYYRDDDINLDDNDVYAEFQITINEAAPIGLKVMVNPTISTYYIGQEFNPGGLIVSAVYPNGVDASGNQRTTSHIIAPDEYEISGFDSSKAVDDLVMTVTFKANRELTTTFTVDILVAVPSMTVVNTYPRTTYNINEPFSAQNFDMYILYSDSSRVSLTSSGVIYYKDANGYYTITNNDLATKTAVTEDEALAQGFYFDVTKFDSSVEAAPEFNERGEVVTPSPVRVSAIVNDGLYPKCKSVDFDITIMDNAEYIWRSNMLGALDQGGNDGASITVKKSDGTSQTSYKESVAVDPQVMVNGVLPDVQSVNIKTVRKSGKIATDHDGMPYYFTTVDASKNFELSADIYVDSYLCPYEEMDDTQKPKYDKAIKEGYSEEVAKDMARDGQEGFGIIAKDTIQYAGGVVDDKYVGNTAKDATVPENAAKLYLVFDGNNKFVSYAYDKETAEATRVNAGNGAWVEEAAASIYEAYALKMPIRTSNGDIYDITSADLNKAFATNMVIAGGITDGTFPTDPNSSSYYKKYNMDRINLMVRTGVKDTSGTGSNGKEFVESTTDHLPMPGDKYKITLRKFKTGYQISTAEYIKDAEGNFTGELGPVNTKFGYDNLLNSSGMLQSMDRNHYCVGFFSSRRAEITVSNIKMSESNPNTDPNVNGIEVETTTPRITVQSSPSSPITNYTLRFKSNASNNINGTGTVTYEGKQIWDGPIGSSSSSVLVNLKPNDINKFVITYYPNTADTKFVNYNTVVKKFYVTHNDFLGKGEIYIAPDGKETGKGTPEDPVDLETALMFMQKDSVGIMADGTYNLRNDDLGELSIDETRSGTANHPITLKAADGAHPVIDLQKKYVGFNVDANYWVFNGLTIINSKDNEKAFGLGGNHCVVEYCTFYDNGTTGFQVSRISSDDNTIESWPSYNVIRSCESFNNFDPSQNNADGFGAKLTVGYGNVFIDCVSHHNADDGWDCYTKLGSGAIGASTLVNCITYKQGHQLKADGTDELTNNSSGGNGFKLGGEDIFVKHYLKDCITYENAGNGVDTNNNPAIKVRNVVSYMNMEHNFGLYGNPIASLSVDGSTVSPEGKTYKYDYDLEGAISIGSKAERIYGWNVEGTENYANIREIDKPSNYLIKENGGKALNSEGEELDVDAMIKSTEKTGIYGEPLRYVRNADGSFIHGDFLALKTPYNHNPEDEVILPTLDGKNGNVGPSTEGTTSDINPSTPSGPSGGGSSGGGGGGGSAGGGKVTVKEATTQATTTDTTEDSKGSVITKDVKVTIGAKEIVVGDETIPVDASAYIQKDSSSTLVPLRFVAIAILGGSVEDADTSSIVTWDATAKAATIHAGDDTIVFTAGSPDMVINGTAKTMANGVKAEISNDRMYVPFRALGEALGVDVEWDPETKTASYIAPVVEEDADIKDVPATKDQLASAAETLDQLLSVSVEKAEGLSDEDKAVYAEKCDKLATIQQEVASEMTDEEVQAAYDILVNELADYFRTELPEKVGTIKEVDAKADEIMEDLISKAEAAEAAEAETAEVTTVAE